MNKGTGNNDAIIMIKTVTRRAITGRQIDRILVFSEERAHRSTIAAITKMTNLFKNFTYINKAY
jgi:putative ribosome biogenesis GTPase RsgA